MTSSRSKSRSTFYSAEKVMNARVNADRYPWAARIREHAVSRAERYLSLGHDRLWNMVTSQRLPRSYAVNQEHGCPVCGKDMFSFGRYSWYADPVAEPWKINCPNCHSKFPANDFGSFYTSGLDEQGLFQPELADRSLLVNRLYPQHGTGWGVDDGYGWVDEQGNRWTFLAFYNHWKIWMHALENDESQAPSAPYLGHGGMIECGLDALREAYILSGDVRYAQAGLILLDRVADVYPSMDISLFRFEDGYKNSHGMRGTGKVVGCIWETFLVKSFAMAYDAFFPAIHDPETIRFLNGKANKYLLTNKKQSGDDIKRNIEEGLLLSVLSDIQNEKIMGNNGMHQSALALTAVVLDRPALSESWLSLLFGKDERLQLAEGSLGDGHLLVSLINNLDRDGMGNEAAPHYNQIWIRMFRLIADITYGYESYPQADLYKQPCFIKMLKAHRHLTMCGKFTVSIGDSGRTGNPHVLGDAADSIEDFERTGDPEFAQIAYALNNGSFDGLHGSLFSPDPERTMERMRAAIREAGLPASQSVHLSGFGFAALRDGAGDAERDIWMYYGRNFNHGHRDTLNIGMHAFGLDLSPDLGYPDFADNNKHRHHWNKHTVSHNTVMVDRTMQSTSSEAKPRHYAAVSGVQFIEVEAPQVYPQTELYMRSTAQIRIDDSDSYGFDVFRVNGGREHHFIFHGAEGDVQVGGLSLVKQDGGTYAGPHVPYGMPDDADPSDSPSAYCGSGFHYLDNVERDENPSSTLISVDWAVMDTWGVRTEPADIHLRWSMLGSFNGVAITDGTPPFNKPGNPKKLKYAIVHRQSELTDQSIDASMGLTSQFVSIIEAYRDTRLVVGIQALPVTDTEGAALREDEAIAIRIELANGRTDYLYSSVDPTRHRVVDGWLPVQGALAVYSIHNGKPIYAFLQAGAKLGDVIHHPNGWWNGQVLGFTEEPMPRNEIMIKLSGETPLPDSLGTTSSLLIYSRTSRHMMYTIQGIRRLKANCYSVDIGDVSPIHSWVDADDLSKGFRYDITQGDACVIARTSEWRESDQ